MLKYAEELEAQNEARRGIGLPELKIKTRRCNVCVVGFKSVNTWTCAECKYRQYDSERRARHGE